MNDPIVSPWLVYWLGRMDCVAGLLIMTATFAFIGTILVLMFGNIEVDEEDRPAWFRRWRWVFVVLGVSATLGTFTPTRQDLIGVYVASKTTPANIEKAVDAGKVIKDELLADVLTVIEAATED